MSSDVGLNPGSIILVIFFGLMVNSLLNLSLANSTQWKVSSGNIFNVQYGMSPSSAGSF